MSEPESPEGMTVTSEGGAMTLTSEWYRPIHLFGVVFGLGWMAATCALVWPERNEYGPVAGGLLSLLLGAGILATSVVCTINRTVIVANKGGLAVTSEPVAWGFQGELRTAAIASITARPHRSTRESSSGVRHGYVSSWSVIVSLRSGSEQVLLFGLPDVDTANFVTTKISSAVGLHR